MKLVQLEWINSELKHRNYEFDRFLELFLHYKSFSMNFIICSIYFIMVRDGGY
jgi:hypothetical protein